MGRPPIFENVEQLELAINGYFTENNNPTITGLAYQLGFESRQSIYDYEKKNDDFSYTIKRARLLIENHYEELLVTKSVTGAIFALKNFGWADKSEVDHTTKGESINPTPIQFTKGSNG